MLVYAKKCLAATHQLLQLRLSPAQVVMFSKAGQNKAKNQTSSNQLFSSYMAYAEMSRQQMKLF